MTHYQQRAASKQTIDNAWRSAPDMLWPLAERECHMRLVRHHEHAGQLDFKIINGFLCRMKRAFEWYAIWLFWNRRMTSKMAKMKKKLYADSSDYEHLILKQTTDSYAEWMMKYENISIKVFLTICNMIRQIAAFKLLHLNRYISSCHI